ncbi:MAG: creatininase family protein, partial [Ignavibacteria bacterium]|nr:creatininase family protein [Ignavibacteria bacterium]
MKFSSHHWQSIEKYLENDDRCIFPIGCTEQHAYLSMSTDSILAEKISIDAAEPLNIPVLPILNFGHTPLFMDYPGSVMRRTFKSSFNFSFGSRFFSVASWRT